MFFIIAGNTKKLIGQETRKINRNGCSVNAEIKIFKNYITLFFIPIIPLGKKYSIYIPHSDEYFESNYFSKMPEDLLEICKDAGRLHLKNFQLPTPIFQLFLNFVNL